MNWDKTADEIRQDTLDRVYREKIILEYKIDAIKKYINQHIERYKFAEIDRLINGPYAPDEILYSLTNDNLEAINEKHR